MQTLPVTVVILAHRVDSRLLAAINSVVWANDICLVWTGAESSIDLPKIEQLRLLKIFNPVSDFASIRNWALKSAIFEWVFFLDSDEVFDSAGIEEIAKVISNPLIDGATVTRRDVFLKQEVKYGEVGATKVIRLVHQHKAEFERRVHEYAVVKGHVASSKIVLYHFAHCSIADFLEKVIKYVQIEQVERTANHQKFRLSELLIFPVAKFCQNYFFRLGFLDGWRGLVYAYVMSVHSFAVRALLYEK
jgi:hypothetical protein